MADEAATTTDTESTTPTSTEQGTDSGDSNAGAGTQTQTTEAAKTFTQAEVDAMFSKRLAKAVKAELKKMSGEEDGQPTVQELQQRVQEAEGQVRLSRARDQVEDFVADRKNLVVLKNVKLFLRAYGDEFQFDDEGRITNLKDLFTQVKAQAPELLGTTGSADGLAGTNGQPAISDMNAAIRRAAGRG